MPVKQDKTGDFICPCCDGNGSVNSTEQGMIFSCHWCDFTSKDICYLGHPGQDAYQREQVKTLSQLSEKRKEFGITKKELS